MVTKKEQYVARAQFDAYLKQFPLIEQERILEERLGLAQELQDFQANREASKIIRREFNEFFQQIFKKWVFGYQDLCSIVDDFVPSLRALLAHLKHIVRLQERWLKKPVEYRSYATFWHELLIPYVYNSSFVCLPYTFHFWRTLHDYTWRLDYYAARMAWVKHHPATRSLNGSLYGFLGNELEHIIETLSGERGEPDTMWYELDILHQDLMSQEAEVTNKNIQILMSKRIKELEQTLFSCQKWRV